MQPDWSEEHIAFLRNLYTYCCSSQYLFTYDACKAVPCGNPDKCSGGGGCLASESLICYLNMSWPHGPHVLVTALTVFPLQACQDGGGENIFGIASADSVL